MTALALAARGLRVAFRRGSTWLEAVRGLDLEVRAGETLAVVGESGCGKSVAALSMIGLLPDNARIVAGEIELLGQPISRLPEREVRALRGNRIGMVFQDPGTSLNPVLSIGEHITDAILAHRPIGRKAARAEAVSLLGQVRLPAPDRLVDEYPHRLSGGMRQRAMIALAVANRPDVLIADEPTTALDATVQHEVLDLLREIQRRTGMAMVLITHDLGVVGRWADRVLVMYAGARVEEGAAASVAQAPRHPYSQALIEARPRRRSIGGGRQRLNELAGAVPAPGYAGPGCSFAPRCPLARALCRHEAPPAIEMADGIVACHAMAATWTASSS